MRTRRPTAPATRRRLAVLACAAVLPATGCGADAPLDTPQAEVRGGAIGPDEAVGENLEVLAVQLAHPSDGVYEEGEDAELYLAISNTGDGPDVLVDVTGPDFADVRSSGAGDGGALTISVPAEDNVYVGAEGEPALTLVDLGRSLRSSESVPVTFTFERAGAVTVEAMVAAAGTDPTAGFDFLDPAEDPSAVR